MSIESQRPYGRGAKECLDFTVIVENDYARYPQEMGAETEEESRVLKSRLQLPRTTKRCSCNKQNHGAMVQLWVTGPKQI